MSHTGLPANNTHFPNLNFFAKSQLAEEIFKN